MYSVLTETIDITKKGDGYSRLHSGEALPPTIDSVEAERFATFRRYTTLPPLTAGKLARMLSRDFRNGEPANKRLLDVGAGDATFEDMLIRSLHTCFQEAQAPSPQIHFDWLEPNADHVAKLRALADDLADPLTATVIPRRVEDYAPNSTYDAILISHMHYYVPESELDNFFLRMLQLLRQNGRLYVVGRDNDDDIAFIHKFYLAVKGHEPPREYVSTIHDVIAAIERIREGYPDMPLNVFKRFARGQIVFPFHDRPIDVDALLKKRFPQLRETDYALLQELILPIAEALVYDAREFDAHRLVEFYLDTPWEEIPVEIQNQIRSYILGKPRRGQFQQVDGIYVVKKLS